MSSQLLGMVPASVSHDITHALLGLVTCLGVLFFIQFVIKRRSFGSPNNGCNKKSTAVDYTKVFPPSQRSTLLDVAPKETGMGQPSSCGLSTAARPILRLEEDYRRASLSTYNFSGFTVGEIRSLGDFPDYARLSGVPLPLPLKDFNIDHAKPRPYRPFRWTYHQTMSFKKMDPDYWLELESTYRERIQQRQNLYAEHGGLVLQALPGSELACKELLEMVIQFLCARYPSCFKLAGRVLVNHILGTQYDLTTADPLQVLLENVPEDFCIMLRDHETGRYVFRAGVICSSVGWNLGQKIGQGLPGIHEPVPDYKERMEFSMDRYFSKMPTYSPIQRGSWGLEIGEPLYLPPNHPALEHRESQSVTLRPKDINLRVDWQNLRRLPLSGAVVFNFKALFTPLEAFAEEPYVPSLLLKILNEGKESLMKYKGTWHVEHVAKLALERYERAQIEKGMIERGWNPGTLDEYPFYRGWETHYSTSSA